MYTPAQVARRANAHPNSIRNWAREYGELLSAAARGETGPRLFDDADVDILCAIAALRKSGVPPSEVVGRIRAREDAPPVVDVAATPSAQESLQAIQMPDKASDAIQIGYSGLQSRVEVLERRVDNGASQLVTGIVIGAAVVLVVVAIVLSMV